MTRLGALVADGAGLLGRPAGIQAQPSGADKANREKKLATQTGVQHDLAAVPASAATGAKVLGLGLLVFLVAMGGAMVWLVWRNLLKPLFKIAPPEIEDTKQELQNGSDPARNLSVPPQAKTNLLIPLIGSLLMIDMYAGLVFSFMDAFGYGNWRPEILITGGSWMIVGAILMFGKKI